MMLALPILAAFLQANFDNRLEKIGQKVAASALHEVVSEGIEAACPAGVTPSTECRGEAFQQK